MRRLFDHRASLLLLSLLASVILHGFAFFFPFFREAGGANVAIDQGQGTRTGLDARLKPQADAVQRVEVASGRAAVADAEQEAAGAPSPDDVQRPMPPAVEELNVAPSIDREYYASSELTVKPKPRWEISRDSWGLGSDAVSGRLELLLHINAQGDVVSVAVESGDMPEAVVFATVKSFQQLQFVPGELHGRKVGVVMRIEVLYDEARSAAITSRSARHAWRHRHR